MGGGIFGAVASAFELISSETLTAPAANFTTVTIPAGFNQIQVIMDVQLTAAPSNANMLLNSDIGTNCNYQLITADGLVLAANWGVDGTEFAIAQGKTADLAMGVNCIIGNHVGVSHSIQSISAQPHFLYQVGGNWNVTDQITTILVSGAFKANSSLLVLGSRW